MIQARNKVVKVKGAVISLGSKSSLWVVEAMKKYFKTVDHLSLKDIEVTIGSKDKLELLYKNKPFPKYDCVYIKGSFRFAPILKSIATILEGTTYLPLTPQSYTIAHDKLLTQLELQKHKVPMPKTYITPTIDTAKELLKKINFPIVMKFPSGTQGKGVMFAESLSSATSLIDALDALNQPTILQEYIETAGVDTRAIVVGDNVVASMKRNAIKGEKRANIHAGGIGEACLLDMKTKKIAIKTAKAIGADICGVDILESVKGPVVLEVNVSPGLQGITAATKIDVADRIAYHLAQEAKKFKEKDKSKGASLIMEDIKADNGEIKEVITALDFRGERILLPELVTNAGKFKEGEECTFEIKNGKVIVKRFMKRK